MKNNPKLLKKLINKTKNTPDEIILQAIERMKRDYELAKSEDAIDIDIFTEDIRIVLNLIEKQDKIIDEMAKYIMTGNRIYNASIDEVKEYFKKKVEDN